MNNDEKIVKALESLQAGQTRLEKTVSTLQADVATMKSDLKTVKQDVKTVDQRVETVDQKVELLREENRKDHTDIMDKLFESNEINGQELKKLEKQVDKLAEEQISTHKN